MDWGGKNLLMMSLKMSFPHFSSVNAIKYSAKVIRETSDDSYFMTGRLQWSRRIRVYSDTFRDKAKKYFHV